MNKEKDDIEKKDNTYINLKAAQSASASELKKDYNAKDVRRSVDDVKKRNDIRDKEIYGNKKTTKDPYTNKTLHKSKDAAEAKYGKNKTTEHTGQMDHTVPLEKIYNAAQYNPFLDKEAIKRIANTTNNYKFINEKLNKSKGSMTNLEYVFKNWKKMPPEQAAKMLEADFTARIAVSAVYAKETMKGIGKEGARGAISSAKYEAIISGYSHLSQVISGDEDADEALINVAKDTGGAMITGGGMAIVTKGVQGTVIQVADKLKDEAAKKALTSFCQAGYVSKMVVSVKEIGSSMIRYINNDITFDQMVLELGEKGTGFATSLVAGGQGAITGGIIGAFIGNLFLPGLGAGIGGKIGAVAGELIGNMLGYSFGVKMYDYISFMCTNNGLAHQHYLQIKNEQEQLRKLLDGYQEAIEREMEILNIKEDIFQSCFDTLQNNENSPLFFDALDTISYLSGFVGKKMERDEFYDIMMDKNKKFSL